MNLAEINRLLTALYPAHVDDLEAEITKRAISHGGPGSVDSTLSLAAWTEHDAWLITYPDQFSAAGRRPLAVLADAFRGELRDMFNGLHVLPFYPWSSDDGYSIIDYEAVDPRYGTWADVEDISASGRLMVDAVINHMSAQSHWFKGFLDGDPAYARFFRTAHPDADVAGTVRPRSSPLLHTFESAGGPIEVWTTFSADQVDLDFRSPGLFLRVFDVLANYASRGVAAIRLDAISYLWKTEGTSSINLPETHLVIQLLRRCLDLIYPEVQFITETNVPHDENLAYLGRGVREAQGVYQFALPPLTLHAFATGDAGPLGRWASDLPPLAPGTTYFNFLASHDGIGLRPAEGILSASDVARLIEMAGKAGAWVSAREGPTGDEPYEINTTWFSAVGRGRVDGLAVRRHLASHAVMLALQGMPGVYVHSLFATSNDMEAVGREGSKRAINRMRFTHDPFEQARSEPASLEAATLSGMRTMLGWRKSCDAFRPGSEQTILDTPSGQFGVERRGPSSIARVYVNVTDEPLAVAANQGWRCFDGGEIPLRLDPAESLWLLKA